MRSEDDIGERRRRGQGPYRTPLVRPPRDEAREWPRGVAVVVAGVAWMTFLASRAPAVLLGAVALSVPALVRRVP